MKTSVKIGMLVAAAMAVAVLTGSEEAKADGYIYVSDSYYIAPAAQAYYVPAPVQYQQVVGYRPVVQYQPVVQYRPVVEYAPVVQPAPAPAVVIDDQFPKNYYRSEEVKGDRRNGKVKYKVYRPRFLFGPEKVYEAEVRYKNGRVVDFDEEYDH